MRLERGVKKSILVRTGYGRGTGAEAAGKLNRAVVVDDLPAAADWILTETEPDVIPPRCGGLRSVRPDSGFTIRTLCAASLDTSARRRPRPSCSKDCGGWNIAATTARAWPCCTTADLLVRKKKGKIDEGLARDAAARSGRRAARHRPHPLGHPRPALATRTPTRTSTSPARSPSSTTASSRTTIALKQRLLKAGHKFQSSTDTEVLAHLIGEHYAEAGAAQNGATAEPADPGRVRRAARSHRHLRHRRHLHRAARRDRRRAARFAADHRHRQRRELPRPATPTPSSPTRGRWFI